MPESKQMPEIKRLQGGVIVPYNAEQITRANEEDEQEIFYKFRRIKLNQQPLPSLFDVKKTIIRQLQQDLHEHIYINYDPGAQNTINAYAQKARRQGRSDIEDECERILDWIDNCLDHYYTTKSNILSATNSSDVIVMNWDFNDYPKPSDLKSLREIREMF